jgi:FeS assembly protein IscX
MAALRWSDVDEIGYQLNEAHPNEDPMRVRFADLHRWVRELEGFDDDPAASGEPVLEAIQMAWAEYHRVK